MFGLFKNNNGKPSPEWLLQIQETESRWFTFLEKLEAKMKELCEAAIPELETLFNESEDTNKQDFHRVFSGIMGQLNNIRNKAQEAQEEKVLGLYYELKEEVNVLDDNYQVLTSFRTRCIERFHQEFETKYQQWCNEIEATKTEDYEVKYQKVLAEYEAIKDKFSCKQCGGGLTIEKIFFISTYITCPYCQTQNTYEPSTQARGLQHIAPMLAEQRVQHLADKIAEQTNKEREIYSQIHQNRLKYGLNSKDAQEVKVKIETFEAQRQEVLKSIPLLNIDYVKAKYDEMTKILPDFKENHQTRCQNEINTIKKSIV